MHLSADKTKLEIDIADAQEWVERIAKTANEICNDPDCNRIQLNGQHTVLLQNQMILSRWDVLAGLLKDT
jgi:hypothetical protein